MLRKKLGSLSDDMAEQLMIVEEATVQGWKSFYPVKKQPTKKKEKKTVKNTFFTGESTPPAKTLIPANNPHITIKIASR